MALQPQEISERLIAEFISQADVTDSTRTKYRAHLGELARWLARERAESLADATTGDLVHYMAYLKGGDRFAAVRHHRVTGALSAGARKNALASIHSLYRYLVLVDAIARDPSAPIKPPRVVHTPGLHLEPEEVRAILNAPGGTPRERIQVYLLAYTAARTSELQSLRWCDVDLQHGTITLVGKRGKVRVVDIHPRLMSELRRWYLRQDDDARRSPALRRAKDNVATDRVLLTRTGKPVATTVISEQLKRRAVRAGVRVVTQSTGELTSAVSPHAMRRTFATTLLDAGHHIDAIADVLGHTSIDTTRRHYAFASNARRRATVLAYEPQGTVIEPTRRVA